MQYFKKIAACTMAATMLFGMGMMFSGCGSKSGKAEVIQKDDLWFNTKKVKLQSDYDMSEYLLVQHNTPLSVGDKYAILYLGQKNMTKDMMNDKDFDYNTLMLNDVIIYDKEGNIEKKIDINTQIAEEGKVSNITAITPSGDRLCVYYVSGDPNGIGENTNYIAFLNVESGKIEEKKEADIPNSDIVNNVKNIDGYDVITCVNYSDGNTSFSLRFAKDGKIVSSTDFDKDIGKGQILYVEDVYSAGNGKYVANCYGEKGTISVEIDAESGSSSKLDSEAKSEATKKKHSTFDGTEYVMDEDGIRKVNGDKEEDFIPFDNCNVNIGEASNGQLVSVTEDSAVIICESQASMNYLEDNPVIVYELTRASENPNAGKKVIKVAAGSGELSNAEAEGIRVFNDTNKDYFAKLVTYDIEDVDTETEDSDELLANGEKVQASLANQLAVDLMSGDGPDVLIGASSLGELLNDEYLEDLTTYIGGDNGLDLAQYYSNVIDACKTDGKLYFMPNTFDMYGVLCDTKNFDASQVGFTFDQYDEFVKNDCNGEEPYTLKGSKMAFFKECMEATNDSWIKDGKANFDSEEFRNLATFFKENIPDGITSTDEEIYYGIDMSDKKAGVIAQVGCLSNLTSYNYFGADCKLMGLPSSDGRGPSAMIYSSTSISAKSNVKDGAWELVKTLASEDILKYEAAWSIPINIAAEKESIESYMKYNDKVVDMYKELGMPMSDDNLAESGLLPKDSGIPEAYENMIGTVSGVLTSDKSISAIVTEEVQAYFAGQKDLDTVIDTIQNRAQTVIEERK